MWDDLGSAHASRQQSFKGPIIPAPCAQAGFSQRKEARTASLPSKFQSAIDSPSLFWEDQARVSEPRGLEVMVVAIIPAPKSHPSPTPKNNNRFLSLSPGSLFRGSVSYTVD